MTNAAMLPANLPEISTARLPVAYEAAAKAIAECERIDECKGWSDRAAALASYARQAKDDSLRVMAVRIQARAERRCGELLKQIQPARGHENGSAPTRSGAASAAGLSEHQRKTALRLATIPEPEFNRQIESAAPPTVTHLAEQGKVSRSGLSGGISSNTLVALPKGCEILTQFAIFCERNDPVELARTVDIQHVEAVAGLVSIADQWLDRFVANLSGDL